ncbi:MAG: hypothetical protein ACR2GR_11460 [Rhodothermales bacterium]
MSQETAIPSQPTIKVRRRRKRRRRGVPAPIVFYSVAALAAVAAAATYLFGGWSVALSALASGLIVYVLFVNDGTGFIKSRRMRRAYAPRHHFTALEVVLLCALLTLNLFVSAFALVA